MDIFPPDFTSDVGRVRKYIPDLVQLDDPKDDFADPAYMWTDEAIESFIADEAPLGTLDNAPRYAIFRAAAHIMIATANNENLILKKLVTEDLQTDGPSVAKALIAAAQELLARAETDLRTADNEEIFISVPYRTENSYSSVVWGL